MCNKKVFYETGNVKDFHSNVLKFSKITLITNIDTKLFLSNEHELNLLKN